jgi:hypothetical protein
MMAGKLAIHLSFKPLPGLEVLASGAMAVTARTVNGVEVSTLLALEVSDACLLGAACNHRIDGFSVLPGHVVTKALDVFRTEGGEDLIDRGHD